MKFRIHFTVNDVEDSFVVEAETIEEIRVQAQKELARRGSTWDNGMAWSEEL